MRRVKKNHQNNYAMTKTRKYRDSSGLRMAVVKNSRNGPWYKTQENRYDRFCWSEDKIATNTKLYLAL